MRRYVSLLFALSMTSLLHCGGESLDGLGSTVQALSGPRLVYETEYPISGGAFGASYEREFGIWCPYYAVDRVDFAAYNSVGSGWCTANPWRSKPLGWVSEDSGDCRIRVHIGARPWESGTCKIQVYAQEP